MSDRGLEAPPAYQDAGGPVVYRASALGGCLRALALARQGYEALPTPAKMLTVFQAGHEAERQVWAKGLVQGVAQQYVELAISKNILIVGHVDVWEPGSITEVKSQSEAEWKPIRQSPFWGRYAYQISVYMHATGYPCTVLRVLRDSDGNILDDDREVFDVAPKTVDEIRVRVFEAEMLARKDLTEVECERSFPCPFYYTHPAVTGDVREFVDDSAALVLAKDYVAARAEKVGVEGRIKVARQALLEWLGDRGKVELPEGWRLTRYTVKGGHVEFDRAEYEAIRISQPKESNGEAGGDSL